MYIKYIYNIEKLQKISNYFYKTISTKEAYQHYQNLYMV